MDLNRFLLNRHRLLTLDGEVIKYNIEVVGLEAYCLFRTKERCYGLRMGKEYYYMSADRVINMINRQQLYCASMTEYEYNQCLMELYPLPKNCKTERTGYGYKQS